MTDSIAKARGFTVRQVPGLARPRLAGWAVSYPRGGELSARYPDEAAAWRAADLICSTPDEGPIQLGTHIEVCSLHTGGPVVHADAVNDKGECYFVVELCTGGFYVLWGDNEMYADGSAEEGEAEAATLADALAILETAKAARCDRA